MRSSGFVCFSLLHEGARWKEKHFGHLFPAALFYSVSCVHMKERVAQASKLCLSTNVRVQQYCMVIHKASNKKKNGSNCYRGPFSSPRGPLH